MLSEKRLATLRDFFWTGNVQNWFAIDQDLVRDDDYPKAKVSNPDPIPDSVREQIESNLYKLPEPIARMWIVAFFYSRLFSGKLPTKNATYSNAP